MVGDFMPGRKMLEGKRTSRGGGRHPMPVILFTVFMDLLSFGILIPVVPLLLADVTRPQAASVRKAAARPAPRQAPPRRPGGPRKPGSR